MDTEDPFAGLGGLGSGLGAGFAHGRTPFRSQSFNVGSNSAGARQGSLCVHIHLFKQRSVSLRDTVDSLIKTRVQTTIFVFRFAFQAKFKLYYFFRNCFC